MTTTQIFYFDVTVTTVETAYYTQASGTGRTFREALTNAADTERAILAEQGDELISFELVNDTNGTVTDAEMTAKFEAIYAAEDEVQVAQATAAMGMTFADRTRGAQQLPKRRTALYALIDALTPDEMAAYGEYRKAQRNA